jgi:subtilisin family serine protease
MWNAVAGGRANAGKGVKVASMDGGLHKDAPMFSGVGFSYPAGYPAGGLGLTANNNGKIIASRAYFRTWDPPAPGDGNPWPGMSGTPHGTHTGSTAAGNIVDAEYLGMEIPSMSGVAPGAWLMSYRVFYNSVTGDGSFYTAEGIAALEDIVRDGADVVNNSWGGGPGSLGGEFDALDTALRNAWQAGVFVSMSAGNAGPGLGTSDHPSADYISVAATSTSGTLAAGILNVTGPGTVSPSLEGISFSGAEFGAPLPLASTLSYPFVVAGSVEPGNAQGCSPFSGTPFTGKAVLISRGSCYFSDKVRHAQLAGADFAIVYNNAGDSLINMACGDVCDDITIPSIFIGQSAATAMITWYAANPDDATLEIDTHAFQAGNTPDVLASFSSRGPGVGNVLKPDIAAPGVNILAQGYAPGVTGEARHLGYGQASGTSMASPHVAGAAALLRQARPGWSNAYIKSALMSTAQYLEVYNHDGSPAQPLDMGAGRLDLARTTDPGVILDPPSLSFGAILDGSAKSMQVTLTSVASATETYALSTLYTGAGFDATTSLPGFDVSPTSVTLAPGASAQVTVTFDSELGAGTGDNQGYILMVGSTHHAHMPVWARVTEPPSGRVLIIDNDASTTLDLPDYADYYTEALDELGISYDYWDADSYYANPTTIPSAAYLAAYDVVLYFTGDNYIPDGFYSVTTPLSEMDSNILTEFANAGGTVIAMGQDLASVLNSTDENTAMFLYQAVLGGKWLQDSISGEDLPMLPIGAASAAPVALKGVMLDLRGEGDGAANQYYVDEIAAAPFKAPDNPEELFSYTPLLSFAGPYNEQDGIVAMAHRDQPTLERPGVSYLGRSIYTTFGLEGIDNTPGMTSRSELLGAFLAWAMDEPVANIWDASLPNASGMTTFKAMVSSAAGATGVSYRWDFGDGTGFFGPYESSLATHAYAAPGTYTVRVEAVDSMGNRTVKAKTFAVPGSYITLNVPLVIK